jgi:hypothetical protein
MFENSPKNEYWEKKSEMPPKKKQILAQQPFLVRASPLPTSMAQAVALPT